MENLKVINNVLYDLGASVNGLTISEDGATVSISTKIKTNTLTLSVTPVIDDNYKPTINIQVLFNGTNAYGYNGEFLTEDEIIHVNRQFSTLKRRATNSKWAEANENKETFNKLYLK